MAGELNPLKVKIRMDFRSEGRSGRIFGRTSPERSAEGLRESQLALLRHVPFQGITVEEIDEGFDTYVVRDEVDGGQAAYAPALLTLQAESVDDLLRFILREEFRKIEIVSPEEITYRKQDLEKLLFCFSREVGAQRTVWERKTGFR